MNSGAPESICTAPTNVAAKICRPPSRQARSTNKIVHGIHAIAPGLLTQMRQLKVNPFRAKATAETLAAKRLPVQRNASKYIPHPASSKWPRQTMFSDHGNGSRTQSQVAG